LTIEGSDPADPANNNRPKPSNSIDIFLAKGSVFSNKGAKQCTATDTQLQNQGITACPASSRVDNGKASQNSGEAKLKSGNPIALTVAAFNRKGGLILYLRAPALGSQIVLRPSLKGKAGSQFLHTVIPAFKIPNDEVILTKLKLATKARNIGKAVLLKSPPKAKCPAKTHKWTFKTKWNYRDGTKETKSATQKCKA
jgi:hypothetical protein